MGRDQEHTWVLPLASHPPWTTSELLGDGGSSPLQYWHANRSPSSPSTADAAAPRKTPWQEWPHRHAIKSQIAFTCTFPKEKKKDHHSHSCFNLQACNPTHVLPARRRGGGPGTDLLSFVAGSADLYAEFGEQAEAVVRVWVHLCLTPLLTSLQPPIPAQLVSIYTSPGDRTLWPRPACKQRKLPSVTQWFLAMQGVYLQPWELNAILTWGMLLRSAYPNSLNQSSTQAALLHIFLIFIHKEVGSELGTTLTWKAKLFKIQTRTPRVHLVGKRYGKYGRTSSQTRRLPSSGITGPARAADPPPALLPVPAASPVRMLSRSPEVWELQARCSHWGLYKLVFRDNQLHCLMQKHSLVTY